MESNNRVIAYTLSQLYPGTQSQFLQLWRDHITYYEQYLTATEQNDSKGRQLAVQNLSHFESGMADLFKKANSQLDSTGIEQRLGVHVGRTLAYIDDLVAGDQSDSSDTDDSADASDMMSNNYVPMYSE